MFTLTFETKLKFFQSLFTTQGKPRHLCDVISSKLNNEAKERERERERRKKEKRNYLKRKSEKL